MVNDVQSVILEIFKAVKNICIEEGIDYFAIGGTAIGAVRHHGFIPWDDDLDIAVPVEQYGRFLDAMERLLPDEYEVIYFENRKHYNLVFAKVCKIDTTFIEADIVQTPERYTGVWIDVMPIAGVPRNRLSRAVFVRRIAFLESLNHKLALPYTNATSMKGRLLYRLVTPLRHFDPLFAAHRWVRILSRKPFAKSEYVGYTWCHQVKEWHFPAKWFETTVECPFENTTIKVPEHYDEYLTAQFGDYMTLPPEDDRVSHRGFVDLKHSYREYQSGARSVPARAFTCPQ